jgi:probable HAF family extracellular repeat protein
MGPPLTNANGINDSGQVVGSFYTAGGRYDGRDPHAFITGPNGAGVTDLNSLVHPAGVIFTDAIGINNNGQVVAIGVVPEPEIYALFLAGLALVGFTARRKKMNAGGFSLG